MAGSKGGWVKVGKGIKGFISMAARQKYGLSAAQIQGLPDAKKQQLINESVQPGGQAKKKSAATTPTPDRPQTSIPELNQLINKAQITPAVYENGQVVFDAVGGINTAIPTATAKAIKAAIIKQHGTPGSSIGFDANGFFVKFSITSTVKNKSYVVLSFSPSQAT